MYYARKRSFEAISETCPTLETIMEHATDRIKKEITEKFREALVEAYEKIDELETQVGDLEREVTKLEGRLEEYES